MDKSKFHQPPLKYTDRSCVNGLMDEIHIPIKLEIIPPGVGQISNNYPISLLAVGPMYSFITSTDFLWVTGKFVFNLQLKPMNLSL